MKEFDRAGARIEPGEAVVGAQPETVLADPTRCPTPPGSAGASGPTGSRNAPRPGAAELPTTRSRPPPAVPTHSSPCRSTCRAYTVSSLRLDGIAIVAPIVIEAAASCARADSGRRPRCRSRDCREHPRRWRWPGRCSGVGASAPVGIASQAAGASIDAGETAAERSHPDGAEVILVERHDAVGRQRGRDLSGRRDRPAPCPRAKSSRSRPPDMVPTHSAPARSYSRAITRSSVRFQRRVAAGPVVPLVPGAGVDFDEPRADRADPHLAGAVIGESAHRVSRKAALR